MSIVLHHRIGTTYPRNDKTKFFYIHIRINSLPCAVADIMVCFEYTCVKTVHEEKTTVLALRKLGNYAISTVSAKA